ncbi:MAG: putative sulfate exporter family transporter [Bowdeniella nasicola]|nr:putative sulfate exporter family transporter [Bowdeniella nasicola]
MTTLRTLAPGIGLAALAAAVAFGLNTVIPLLSALLIALIIGMIMRNLGLIPQVCEPGFAFVNRTILRLGVVLLGLRLSIPAIIALGPGVVVTIIVTVAATYLVTIAAGRWLKINHATVVLTATGTAICGAAAVAAMSAVLPGDRRAKNPRASVDEAAATAVAAVTLFGTLALLLLPVLVRTIGLDPTQAGAWIGAAVHEVGQVVAGAGIAADQLTGQGATTLTDTAVVTKLGRVAMLAPLVAIVGAIESRRRFAAAEREIAAAEAAAVVAGKPVPHEVVQQVKPPIMPLFVVGFLVMVLVRSFIPLPTQVISGAELAATILLTAAMVAMGSGVRIKRLIATGGRAMLLGAIAAVVSAIVSILCVVFFV